MCLSCASIPTEQRINTFYMPEQNLLLGLSARGWRWGPLRAAMHACARHLRRPIMQHASPCPALHNSYACIR